MQHIHFKKILVPTDFSDTAAKALDHAKWLAKKFYSEITLLHVGEIPAASVTFPSIDLPVTFIGTDYQKMALQKLEEWRKDLVNSGIEKVNIEYIEGGIASSIAEFAANEKMDIVVMGTHGTK
jgi:nucleotide-binding universal stress UspA family protein